MRSKQQSRTWKIAAAVVVATTVAGGIAYLLWQQSRPQEPASLPATGRGGTDTANYRKPKSAKEIDLKHASREDVIDLLAELSQVQKELARLMKRATNNLLEKNWDIIEVYSFLMDNQPDDPLELHGLSIPDFDALLERFQRDQEVHNLIIDVIQGPESDSSNTANTEKLLRELTPDHLVEVNGAMRDRLRSAVNELQSRASELPGVYNSRVGSLTCQTVVGGYVQREFNISTDDVERAMSLHQYELAHRDDFIAINDEIQQLMTVFIKQTI